MPACPELDANLQRIPGWHYFSISGAHKLCLLSRCAWCTSLIVGQSRFCEICRRINLVLVYHAQVPVKAFLAIRHVHPQVVLVRVPAPASFTLPNQVGHLRRQCVDVVDDVIPQQVLQCLSGRWSCTTLQVLIFAV